MNATMPRLPRPGVPLNPARHALIEYVRALEADAAAKGNAEHFKLRPGLFAIQGLAADLAELYAVQVTKGGESAGLASALAMLETAKAMLEAKAEQGELDLSAAGDDPPILTEQ